MNRSRTRPFVIAVCHQFVIRRDLKPQVRGSKNAESPGGAWAFVVAGAGFEPATFGL